MESLTAVPQAVADGCRRLRPQTQNLANTASPPDPQVKREPSLRIREKTDIVKSLEPLFWFIQVQLFTALFGHQDQVGTTTTTTTTMTGLNLDTQRVLLAHGFFVRLFVCHLVEGSPNGYAVKKHLTSFEIAERTSLFIQFYSKTFLGAGTSPNKFQRLCLELGLSPIFRIGTDATVLLEENRRGSENRWQSPNCCDSPFWDTVSDPMAGL